MLCVCGRPGVGVLAVCVCVHTHTEVGCVWYMGEGIGMGRKRNKGVCDNTTICDVCSLGNVWDGVM